MTHGREGMPLGLMSEGADTGETKLRAALPAHREAVRLLDCLIGSADPSPQNGGATFTATLTVPAFDRLTVWLKAGPVAAPYTPDPIAAAQREAARLLRAVMGCLDRVGAAPGGGLRLAFEWDAELRDRVMVWGSAIEDCEVLGEDDEDGADAEQPDYPSDTLIAIEAGVPQGMAGLVLGLYGVASPPGARGAPAHVGGVVPAYASPGRATLPPMASDLDLSTCIRLDVLAS